MSKKLSKTYRLLRVMGLNYPEEEYGQISIVDVCRRTLKTFRDSFLMNWVMHSTILSPLLPRKIRPWILKTIGCNIGKDTFIGSEIWLDTGHADLITIEDHVHVTGRTVLLCHKKDLSHYCQGDDYAKLPYTTGKVHLKKGCSTGTGTIIMPGVTIGEGAIVGAGSLVIKDIPDWTIAVGHPAKVVRHIPKRDLSNEHSDI